jgi:hypothetical protein
MTEPHRPGKCFVDNRTTVNSMTDTKYGRPQPQAKGSSITWSTTSGENLRRK